MDFVITVVDETLAEVIKRASAKYPSHVDEFKEVGLPLLKSDWGKIVESGRVTREHGM